MKSLHRFFRSYLYLLPILNFIITIYAYFISTEYTDWVFIGNLGGYSIVTSLVYVETFCFSRVYCLFTKLTSIGLLMIAIFNTIASKLIQDLNSYQLYEAIFAKIIIFLVITLSISLSTIKCKQR